MSDVAKRIDYRGPAVAVSALAQMLREEGVAVDYDAPEERRGAGELVREVVIGLACNGGWAAIEAGVSRFRSSRFGPHTEVTLFSSDEDDVE